MYFYPRFFGCIVSGNDPKKDARVSFPPFSWGTKSPLIGQAAHGRMAGIIVVTAWQTVSAFHTPGHYTQKPGIVTHVFGELAQVPGHDF